MNTNEQKLIDMIQNNKSELKKWFDDFESHTENINDWQRFLGYPLEPHSCDIVHRIRNNIQSGLSHYYGVKHSNNERFKGVGDIAFRDAVKYITEGSKIREQLNIVYPQIKKLLYDGN